MGVVQSWAVCTPNTWSDGQTSNFELILHTFCNESSTTKMCMKLLVVRGHRSVNCRPEYADSSILSSASWGKWKCLSPCFSCSLFVAGRGIEPWDDECCMFIDVLCAASLSRTVYFWCSWNCRVLLGGSRMCQLRRHLDAPVAPGRNWALPV